MTTKQDITMTTKKSYELGQHAVDTVTGFEGFITALCSHLTGCDQVCLTGRSHDGKPADYIWIDESRCRLTGQGSAQISAAGATRDKGGATDSVPPQRTPGF